MRVLSTSIGRAPPASTSSWKARRSNLSPSWSFEYWRSFRSSSCPIFVAESLRRPRHVAVGLALYRGFINGGVLVKIVDHLLARPVLGVEAGVNDEANRPQHVILQMTIVAVGILEKPGFFAQSLRVQRPSFGKGCLVFVLAEGGQFGQLLRDCDLQVMSRHAFVIRGRLDIQQAALGEVAGVHHDVTRPRTIGSAVNVGRA